jgi:predicted RNA binding protein YcfA (HicA-like mRNA interferase family)
MPGRLRRLTASEVETLLRRHGFVLVRQRGSHRKWRHLERKLQVIVPMHSGRPLPIGTLTHILKGAEIPEEEWRP